jgi:transcription elongation factor GreB
VVRELPGNRDRVFFGAWVTLENEGGAESTFRIVGADEIDTQQGCISVDSPMARALLKKTVDDEVAVQTPAGLTTWIVVCVRY